MRTWPESFVPPVPPLDMAPLRLFDSYRVRVEPVDSDDPITMYVCGITPYDATHLGHAATYISFDLVHRYLRCSGREVIFIENVTDIDDPLFERAERDSVDWRDLGERQVDLFRSDMTNLRVLPPRELVSVSEAMVEIIGFIEHLIRSGLTYKVEDDLYLDSAKVTDFKDLPLPMTEALGVFAERGGDPSRIGKRHPLDPLLWRTSAPGEPEWEASFGSGRPGWHVECNAISARLRSGQTISLQGGGEDLVFPHHYMTSIQGRAYSGSDFAHNFVHTGMIGFHGTKMSKSLGNLVFVSRLVKDGADPMAIRIALLFGHYRKYREWSQALLDEATILLQDLRQLLARESISDYAALMQSIADLISQDLDTEGVIREIREFIHKNQNSPGGERSPGALARFLDSMLGITL